jgi:acyl-CoA synthetase (NDP forming)/RimJ/RimL family protein N-acetyltransferase
VYPEAWEVDVVTADGGTVRVRPIRPDDRALIETFHARQSAESIYFRFFSPHPRLGDAELKHMVELDYRDRMAFVAVLDGELVGIARYDRPNDRDRAEVAFFIDDAHHGRGLATLLLEYLAAYARDVGLPGFTAQVLPQNRRMLSVFKQAGFDTASQYADGVVEVRFDIEPTAGALAATREREHSSDVRSIARLLEPESVAVIGASRQPGTIGHELVRNLLAGGFAGPVYAVNPTPDDVLELPAFPSVLDIGEPVDLAVVAVPAADVLAVAAECARAHVRALVVVSAGFADAGEDGALAEQALLSIVRRHGMRLLGPNCMGLVNTAPDVRLHATFAPVVPAPGRVAMSSQSGPLGTAMLDRAAELGLGISAFVSVGNRADVSSNDLLSWWEDDERTAVVLLYVEGFGNPRRFARLARRLSRAKPVVAVKSGHDATTDALLRQTGLLRVDTLEQLFDVARLLIEQPLPAGRRVAIVANSGSVARLTGDACEAAGLEVVSHASGDLGHRAGAGEYERALATALADPDVDAALVVYAPPLVGPRDAVARAVDAAAAAAEPPKPVVASYLGRPVEGAAVPTFRFPDTAAIALGRVAAYGAWRAQPEGTAPALAPDAAERAGELVSGWLAAGAAAGGGAVVLDTVAACELLEVVGLAPVPRRLACSAAEAAAAAAALGYPVALKATGLERLAKTEAGGVALDVHGDDEVTGAYERMHALLGDAMVPTVVQRMVEPGVDLRVAVHRDPSFGPVISLGAGGAGADAVDPGSVRILPLTDVDAARLFESARAAAALHGDDRGRDAVLDLLSRVALLVDEVPDVATVVLNPVIVAGGRCAITDVRIELAPWPAGPDPDLRRL